MAPRLANAQHVPKVPWSFTGDTLLMSLKSYVFGKEFPELPSKS